MVSSVFPNHMTTAMMSLQLASFWILSQENSVAAYRINFILDQTQWVACLLSTLKISPESQFCEGYMHDHAVYHTVQFG